MAAFMVLVLGASFTNGPLASGAPAFFGTVLPSQVGADLTSGLADAGPRLIVTASATPTSGPAPLQVAFTGTVAGGNAPYTYDWTFGDGATSSQADPSHTYSQSGSFTPELTVKGAAGVTATTSINIVTSGTSSGTTGKLVTAGVVATTSGSFWSVDAQTSCATCIESNQSVKNYLASTPFTWVRYGQGIDSCNISAARSYSSSGVASTGCGFNMTSLKSWCDSTTPHCHTIISLPGENNNSREDAAIAKWIVRTVGIQPDYWSIGNEPTGWTHYGLPWTSWKTTDAASASPLAYAFDVKVAITAVSAVDPGAKFLGIEAACSCNTLWFQDVAHIDGASLAGIAVHNYPSSGSTTETLAKFYAPLSTSSNITNSVATVRSALAGQCTACGTLPIFVNEYNAGPGWAPSNYGGTYANAVFLAASVTQALTSNVSQMTVFNLESSSSSGYGFALLNSHGSPGPTGTLYSGLLRHLAGGTVTAAHVSTTLTGVWAVATTNASMESILVVNANLTHPLALSLGLGLLSRLTATRYEWNSTLAAPRELVGTLAGTYLVPSQGILLVSLPKTVGLAPLAPGPSPSAPATSLHLGGSGLAASPGLAAVAVAPLAGRPRRPA
ncbi:MAG: PKD domain-containing protein [Thermoplasmata archaeon]|nr:PKD domain-containing protein [Thermoplasmata archaeon]